MKRMERKLNLNGYSASIPAIRPKFLNSCHTQLSSMSPMPNATKISHMVSATGHYK